MGKTYFFTVLLVAFFAAFFPAALTAFFAAFFPGALAALRTVALRTPLIPRTAPARTSVTVRAVSVPTSPAALIAPLTARCGSAPRARSLSLANSYSDGDPRLE